MLQSWYIFLSAYAAILNHSFPKVDFSLPKCIDFVKAYCTINPFYICAIWQIEIDLSAQCISQKRKSIPITICNNCTNTGPIFCRFSQTSFLPKHPATKSLWNFSQYNPPATLHLFFARKLPVNSLDKPKNYDIITSRFSKELKIPRASENIESLIRANALRLRRPLCFAQWNHGIIPLAIKSTRM